MRNKSFAALGTLALIVAASAYGQQRVAADIPFEFSLANKVMPAGHYEITTSPTYVLVSSYATGAAAFSAANRDAEAYSRGSEGKLVFNRYGDKYFLAAVRPERGTGSGAVLIESKTEERVAHTSGEVAHLAIPLGTGAATQALLK